MHLGLRAKSALALLGSILLVLALAIAAGWRIVQYIEVNLGMGFARNVTRLNKQRILTPVLRELALAQQLAHSEVTLQWLKDQNNPAKKALFFAEAEQYRKAFEDHSYFLIVRDTRHYYFNDNHDAYSNQPRYTLKQNDPHDMWFFSTMKSNAAFNINVDPDTKLKLTKVWFNVLVKDKGRNIGLAGTGLSLTSFLKEFITSSEAGVTPIIINGEGAIQAYPDPKLIDYSSINNGTRHSTIYQLIKEQDDVRTMHAALELAKKDSKRIPVFWATLNGSPKLFAVTSVPQLGWFVVTAVDLKTARVLDQGIWLPLFCIVAALLVLLMLAVSLAVNRIVLQPLLTLTHSAQTVAAGNYDVALPPAGGDELGDLTRAFGAMAQRVRSHTNELEGKVAERTSALMDVNRKIDDSIQYARLIQNAILPGREMEEVLGENYFVLWQPRDVVGGDFYVFRSNERGCLLGVLDCAGHGVPGAFMTMIAHSALNVAAETQGLENPAALLDEVDERIRAVLQEELQDTTVTTHMDAGLAYINFETRTLTYSGAKISLYWCTGSDVGELNGSRHAIGGKKKIPFINHQKPLAIDETFYLTTDGLLDQAGGSYGFGFGRMRFFNLLRTYSQQPFAQQREAFIAELSKYQGSLPQRDDITVMGFRFTPPGETA